MLEAARAVQDDQCDEMVGNVPRCALLSDACFVNFQVRHLNVT